jgi:hypothetical protein
MSPPTEPEPSLDPALRPPEPSVSPERLAAVLAAVQAETAAAPAASWSTRRRAAAAAAVGGIGLLLFTFQGEVRDGLGDPMGVAGLLGLAAGLAVSGWETLRPIHRGPARPGVVAAALAMPVALSFAPVWPGIRWNSVDPMTFALHEHCLQRSFIAAVATTTLLLMLDRSPRPSLGRRLAAAASGGLAGFASLMATCVLIEPAHLLIAHATPGVALAALFTLAAALRPRP